MLKKLLPLLLILTGLGAGAGAGLALRPPGASGSGAPHEAKPGAGGDTGSGDYPETQKAPAPDDQPYPDGKTPEKAGEKAPERTPDKADGYESPAGDGLPDYIKLNNQFIVPVVEDGRVASMVILSLSLEVQRGSAETVYAREPKLRDAFLQVMFDHANAGGFSGAFTDGANLVLLRTALREVAVRTLGDMVSDVLIVDIVRQDS